MKKFLWRATGVLALIALLLAAALSYAYFIEPRRLVVNEHQLAVPNFSPELNGLKIAAVSDIHGGSNHETPEKLREIVKTINEQHPDIVVLLGDYVSENHFDHQMGKGEHNNDDSRLRMPVADIAAGLTGIEAKYGVFAVIGNHDWWHNEAAITKEFEGAGIRVLENEIAGIPVGSQTVWLWGIEDYWKNRRVPTVQTYDIIAEKRNIIALTHNPDSLLKAPDGISLMLAGHSHGGQVRFPLFGAFAFVNDPRFMAGEADVDGRKVFVTTGIGCTGPQIRLNVPPEVALLTLTSKQ